MSGDGLLRHPGAKSCTSDLASHYWDSLTLWSLTCSSVTWNIHFSICKPGKKNVWLSLERDTKKQYIKLVWHVFSRVFSLSFSLGHKKRMIHKNLESQGFLTFNLSSETLSKLALGRPQMAHHLSMHAWPGPVTEVRNHRASYWAHSPEQPHRQASAASPAQDAPLAPWYYFKIMKKQLVEIGKYKS